MESLGVTVIEDRIYEFGWYQEEVGGSSAWIFPVRDHSRVKKRGSAFGFSLKER